MFFFSSFLSGYCVCVFSCFFFFFFNDTATTEIYTLSLTTLFRSRSRWASVRFESGIRTARTPKAFRSRSEEHTSELQSLAYLVCRLLLEKKKKNKIIILNYKKKKKKYKK